MSSSSSKFVSEPKKVYSLEIDGLDKLVAYYPNRQAPEGLRSLVTRPRGSLFAHMTAVSAAPKHWSTIQVSKESHVEVNSALLYLNHSCEPSMEICTKNMELRVSASRDLQIGDELSFFYPSTEFHMDKSFVCCCGAGEACLGTITGADQLSPDQLGRYVVNGHILQMKKGEQ